MINNLPYIRGYWPIYLIILLSIVGTLAFYIPKIHAVIFTSVWSLQYIIVSPFMHAGLMHALLNIMGLHFIGGQMLLPVIGKKRFCWLFVLTALSGTIMNSLLGHAPAIGISAAVLGMLSCALYPFAHVQMKLLLIHDLFKLPPFPLWSIAVFIVALDICGIIFDWRFFAHWGHLGGVIGGGIIGYIIFRHRRGLQSRSWRYH